jgi:SAM-dependent methyltransferase
MALQTPAAAPRTAEEIMALFASRPLSGEMRSYLRYNAVRYAWLLERVDRALDEVRARRPGEPVALLDVGMSFQTELLRAHVPDGRLDTLGWFDARFEPDPNGRHVDFDLNQAGERDRWPPLAGYDLVLMAEVIEHLSAGAVGVLGCLAAGLRPGGWLLVQTPNAVALHKRVRMLAGRNPLAPLPENRPGQAHLHEYTAGELVASGRAAGLKIESVEGANYFGTGPAARAYAAAGRLLPLRLRHGLLVAMRAPR